MTKTEARTLTARWLAGETVAKADIAAALDTIDALPVDPFRPPAGCAWHRPAEGWIDLVRAP